MQSLPVLQLALQAVNAGLDLDLDLSWSSFTILQPK